jgi:hypothetical protein
MNVKVKKVGKWILWGLGIYALVGAAITIPFAIRDVNRDDAKKATAAAAYQADLAKNGGDVSSLPAPPSPAKTDDSGEMAAIVIGAALAYFLPGLLGLLRKSNRLNAIFLLNLLLGWTVVGWVVAFIWAIGGDSVAQAKSKIIDYDKLAAAMQAKAVPPPPVG